MRNTEEIIKEILTNRGVVYEEDINEFLSDAPKRTYDPFLLDGIREGVDLLLSEIDAGGTVCIYGDYDADGVTSVCVMSRGIGELTDRWFYYIPSRFEEGYGLNCGAIDKIKERGATLLLTVDCGCVSYKEVEYAKSLGLKVIVTDHHNIEDTIADCIVIDPKKPENFRRSVKEAYPCRELAGCGVAFKFIQALQRTAGLPRSVLNDVLDMVAIGTVGDIVPLKGENRTLVKYGINAVNSGRRKALRKLVEAISLESINSENIAYGVVPHINASGRMASASEAAELFLSENDSKIKEQIDKLIYCNNERKKIQEKAYKDALEYIEGDVNFAVLNIPDLHEGIAGIVAGKIKDKINRPVIIITPTEDGRFKGTGRSVSGINIYEILNKNSELFLRFGGHKSACGFLMEKENLDRLIEGVNKETDSLLEENPKLFERKLNIDMELEIGEASLELAKELLRLAPFGEGNPSPKFMIRAAVPRKVSYMGENKNHARFYISQKNAMGTFDYVNCILFRRAEEEAAYLEGDRPADLVGSLSYQVWRGQGQAKFIVEEII